VLQQCGLCHGDLSVEAGTQVVTMCAAGSFASGCGMAYLGVRLGLLAGVLCALTCVIVCVHMFPAIPQSHVMNDASRCCWRQVTPAVYLCWQLKMAPCAP
jgi:hypothetical protein